MNFLLYLYFIYNVVSEMGEIIYISHTYIYDMLTLTSPFYNRIVNQGYISLMMIEICVFGLVMLTWKHTFTNISLLFFCFVLFWILIFASKIRCECVCEFVEFVYVLKRVWLPLFLLFYLLFFSFASLYLLYMCIIFPNGIITVDVMPSKVFKVLSYIQQQYTRLCIP